MQYWWSWSLGLSFVACILVLLMVLVYVSRNRSKYFMYLMQCLTGGILLLRNKFYIILYRGNDFLPKRVAALVENRELELKSFELHEEVARMKALEALSPIDEVPQDTSTSGTLTEFKEIQTKFEDAKKGDIELNLQLEAEICRLEKELKEEQHRALIVRCS